MFKIYVRRIFLVQSDKAVSIPINRRQGAGQVRCSNIKLDNYELHKEILWLLFTLQVCNY